MEKNPQKNQLTTVSFIRLVLAVRISVTLPGQSHTFPVVTAELSGSAVCSSVQEVSEPVASAPLRALVGTVRAIRVSVTAPHEGDAL